MASGAPPAGGRELLGRLGSARSAAVVISAGGGMGLGIARQLAAAGAAVTGVDLGTELLVDGA